MLTAIIYDTKDDALQRSREAWEAVLGRKKYREDITEFLWSVIEHPESKLCAVLIEANEKTELTTIDEKAAMVSIEAIAADGFFAEAKDVIVDKEI